MNPSELTIEGVREEFKTLIQRNPDRTGSVMVRSGYNDSYEEMVCSCVYYTDEDGNPITSDYSQEEGMEIPLIHPVCIVGQWVEDYHPEYKQDIQIRRVLRVNRTIRSTHDYELPFPEVIKDLLANVQDAQDSDGIGSWKDIEL